MELRRFCVVVIVGAAALALLVSATQSIFVRHNNTERIPYCVFFVVSLGQAEIVYCCLPTSVGRLRLVNFVICIK